MRYFKIIRYSGTEDYVPIDETELEKAIYAHLSGKVGVFANGSINGDAISMIVPDWNRAMSWNPGYKPTPEESGEIQIGIGRKYGGIIALAKERVNQYLANGTPELIGTRPLLIENPHDN